MSSEQVLPSFIAAEQYTVVVISHVWQQQTAAIPDCDLGDLRESLQQQGSVCAAVTAGRERIGGNQVAAALFGLCVPKT
jgi:hypothetical protein